MAEKKVPINFIFKGIDELSGPLRAVNKRIAETTAPLKKFQGQIQSFGKLSGINQLGTAISGVTKEVAGLGLGLVAAATGAYFAIDKLVGATIKQNAALADTAKKTGLSVEQLQLWHFAAEQSGLSTETFNAGLIKFTKTLGETRRGQGALVELLGNDSQFITQLRGIKSIDKAYEYFLTTLGNVPDSVNQNALSVAGLGRGGAEIIQLAGEAAKGNLKTLFETRAAMGLISKDTAEAFDTVEDSFGKIAKQIDVLKTGIVAKLLPVIQQLADKFSKWVTENQPKILEYATIFADKLPAALETLGQKFKWIWDIVGGFEGALKSIEIIIGAMVVGSIASLINSLVVLGSTLLFTPVGWVILGLSAIAGIMYGLSKLSVYLKGKFDEWLTSLGEWLSSFGGIGEAIKSIFGFVGSQINKIASAKLPGFGFNINENKMAPAMSPAMATAPLPPQNQSTEATIKVRFENQPEGMRFRTENPEKVPLDVYSGFNNNG